LDEGRAGPSYAINDHKGDPFMSKTKLQELKEKIMGLVKTADEMAPKEEAKKEEEAKDASAMYDELVKMVDGLAATIAKMKPAGDVKEDVPEEKEEKAADEEVSPALEERLKKLEEMVAKIMQAESAESEAMADEEAEEGEESEDAGEEEEKGELVGDTGDAASDVASRAEILAPGIQITKDVKVKALKKAYETADGKKAIDSITGGKKPKFESAETVDLLFTAASELLKGKRSDDLAVAKIKGRAKDAFSGLAPAGVVTADKLNEMNAKLYGRAK
jgi:uncharacterized protein